MSAAKKTRAKKRAYHVGDLREQLLAAGEKVLRRDGVAGLGIRSVAREVGVSHTAAKPHFGDLAGFRGELATVGYNRLAVVLEAALDAKPLRAQRIALAKAYVHFAHAHPHLFDLMFRHELVDMRQPALVEASARAVRAMAGPMTQGASVDALPRKDAIRMTAGWSFAHGLAVLVVEKRLRGIQKRAPDFIDLLALAEATIESVTFVVEEPS